ncbi:uncharacterized protein LOC123927745 isoform X2 [Meles meles]|uniref:uncharacterized protein LOC123927745 isoform X2 n=1 Tax=Meles meles TaxID=9662 RepID=UPI001E69B457|nr:uncharacterized protein LOC123927745 isoform X2 [Meles meles]
MWALTSGAGSEKSTPFPHHRPGGSVRARRRCASGPPTPAASPARPVPRADRVQTAGSHHPPVGAERERGRGKGRGRSRLPAEQGARWDHNPSGRQVPNQLSYSGLPALHSRMTATEDGCHHHWPQSCPRLPLHPEASPSPAVLCPWAMCSVRALPVRAQCSRWKARPGRREGSEDHQPLAPEHPPAVLTAETPEVEHRGPGGVAVPSKRLEMGTPGGLSYRVSAFGSGDDPGVTGWSHTSGSLLGGEPASPSPAPPGSCFLSRSLSVINKNEILKLKREKRGWRWCWRSPGSETRRYAPIVASLYVFVGRE